MPIYEYECEQCFCRFELFRRAGENGEASCPQCQGRGRRLFSSVPMIFRGTRWVAEKTTKREGSQSEKRGANKPEVSKKPENNV